jgi:hypothetical protein
MYPERGYLCRVIKRYPLELLRTGGTTYVRTSTCNSASTSVNISTVSSTLTVQTVRTLPQPEQSCREISVSRKNSLACPPPRLSHLLTVATTALLVLGMTESNPHHRANWPLPSWQPPWSRLSPIQGSSTRLSTTLSTSSPAPRTPEPESSAS